MKAKRIYDRDEYYRGVIRDLRKENRKLKAQIIDERLSARMLARKRMERIEELERGND